MSSHSIPDTPPTHTKDDIRKLIKAMGGRPISFNRAYAKIAGSVEAGLMLAQGVHWSGQADKDGWFFRTQADWEEDTTMSPDQQRTARRKLRPIKHGDQHLWQEKEQGLPKQLFFRVDMDVLAELIIKTEPSSASDRDRQSQGIPTSSDRDSRGLFIGNPDSINKDDEMKDEMKDEMSSFSSGDEDTNDGAKTPSMVQKEYEQAVFDRFWSVYPRKVAKGAARKAFNKVIKTVPLDVLVDAVLKQKKSEQWKDPKFIPHPATWLNDERWEDEETRAIAQGGGQVVRKADKNESQKAWDDIMKPYYEGTHEN